MREKPGDGAKREMTCSFCGTRNNDAELRCRKCGRKENDTLTGEFVFQRTNGALAAQLVPVASTHREPPRVNLAGAVQRSLFHNQPGSNVVEIESYAPVQRPAPVRPRPRTNPAAPAKPPVRRPRRPPGWAPEGQGSLDFLPPAVGKPLTHSSVEALIYCEDQVANVAHRALATALDWSVILIGYGLFLSLFRLCGGEFELNQANVAVFGAVLPFLALAYGLIWALAGTESAGMHWAQLRLTTFEGFPPERKQRFLRMAGSWLSLLTVLGILWSFADEESLGWQDHMSRTFPTPRRLDSRTFLCR